ncbi:MAG: VOC family protein [Gaiellaceae bacterium]
MIRSSADVHVAYRALSSRGLRFLTSPMQPPWGGWRCFAQDPGGYLIEIEQPPAA